MRITPACAGKRGRPAVAALLCPDHPRMCGEKAQAAAREPVVWGSPPHVRGKVIDGVQGQSPCRITPACAGKRELDNSELVCLADHPRVCGEKGRGYSSSYPPLGSPPRVRGKGSIKGYALEWAGITPACAGKRPLAPDTAYNTRDHPRVCGEK